MKNSIKQIKEEQKALAKSIREQKIAFKNAQREIGNWQAYEKFGCKLHKLQWEFRHRHIARCLLRGRTMEQIENKNRDDNKPDQNLINKYYDQYLAEIEKENNEREAIHTDAA